MFTKVRVYDSSMANNRQLQDATNRLRLAVAKVYKANSNHINALKERHNDLKRDDFIWYYLLQSFGTMGRAAGAVGIRKRYQDLEYQRLLGLNEEARSACVSKVCHEARVRFPVRKTNLILGCFNQIKECGGPKAAKVKLLEQAGKNGKITFLRHFPGIGPKYARNLMMDVYHPEFRECIAIDTRIQSISTCIGLAFTNAQYEDHERFYLALAKQAKLEGWELDRLLFNFTNDIIENLDCPDNQQRQRRSTACR